MTRRKFTAKFKTKDIQENYRRLIVEAKSILEPAKSEDDKLIKF